MRVSAQSSFDCTCVVVLNVLYGEAPLQPLIPIYIPLFDRKGYPFHTPSIGKWCPFHIPRLELCIPFNCCKCTHCTIFSAIKCISVSPFTFYLLPTKMSDFTTLWYTLTSEIPILPYAWSLKKVNPLWAELPHIGHYREYSPPPIIVFFPFMALILCFVSFNSWLLQSW